ncbi:MAG: reverse transcriptase domain-containing protein, partial [Sedimenticola sp.]
MAPNSHKVPTPVSWQRLEQYLHGYDITTAQYLIQGFRHGFRLDFEGTRTPQDCHNLRSANLHDDYVTAKLNKELSQGRISEGFIQKPFPNMKCSPLGVVPKKTPGDYRLIHHLSYGPGPDQSVNSGIPKSHSAVSYSHVDDAIAAIKSVGPGSFMAKTDIESAFRIVPVHPDDYPLLGFSWQGMYFYDKALPMGASSSCKIFETFSSALEWIAIHKFGCQNIVHILDDFLFIANSYEQACNDLRAFMDMCVRIGVPLSETKTFSPDTTMTFMGITLDTLRMEARLPEEKLCK